MKKRGFTLIELLAVIVILAIIALIATPIILGIVEDAKKSAAVSSAYGYVKAIEKEYMLNVVKDNGIVYPTEQQLDIKTSIINTVKVQGEAPSKGDVTLSENGTVKKGTFCINKYKVLYDGTKAEIKGNCDDMSGGDVVLKGDPISDIAKKLVYSGNSCKTDGTTYNYMGGCYIKGNPTNNYIWYSGFLWRIMGINADGTVKMITEENVSTLIWGASDKAQDYDNSYIKEWLNNYFINNLKGTSVISNQTWCSETITTSSARTTCTNNLSKTPAKVGLLSIDEYNLASGSSSYLKNNQYVWTLTPYSASNAWSVDYNGSAVNIGVNGVTGFNPVINVNSDTTITGGNGTLSSSWSKTSAPYILNENKIGEDIKSKKLNETVISGEYVKLDNKNYRVVSKDSNGIKLILDSYYTTTSTYGTDSTFSLTTGIGQLLDTTVYNWLFSNQTAKDKVVTSTWNRGNAMVIGANYKTTSLAETNPISNVKVGLIKMGEMLSGQSQTIASRQTYWTLTSYNASAAWGVHNYGYASYYDCTNTFVTRPVIIVKNDLNITGGNGTPSNPYEI